MGSCCPKASAKPEDPAPFEIVTGTNPMTTKATQTKETPAAKPKPPSPQGDGEWSVLE